MKFAASKLLGLAFVLSTATHHAAAQKVHELLPVPKNIQYGYFDASVKPALTIDSSDIVKLKTATGHPAYFEELGVPKEKIPPELFAAFEGVKGSARGDQSLVGPIYVNGAEIGRASCRERV